MKILLAEDNKINAKVATLFLSKMGHEIDVAVNGKAVLSALEDTPYDLVLMDLEMPELSGSEAIEIIRSGKNEKIDKEIPIFALSAHTRDEIQQLYPELRVTGYVNKPLDKNQLSEMLQTIG